MAADEVIHTDFLIIGGGVAGLNAALTARQAGVDVTVMDKAVIERSGHISGGVDHFLAYLETGPNWDSREAYLEFTAKSAAGATNLNVVEKVYCDNLKAALKRFDDVGVPLTQPDGTFFRTQSYGQPGPWFINFNGKRLKPALGRAARAAGCRVLDRVVAGDLLTREGQVCGAAGFHIRGREFFVVSAKAVLVATGGTNRLYQNPTGLSFNTWMCPANTGDGEALAYRAGAKLANVEYLRWTVIPRGFSAAGLNAFVGMGGVFVNGRGEPFMERYHPQGMKGPRYKLVEGVLGEIKAGRGPVYLDCRHLEPEALKHLITTLSYDKDTLPDFFEQKGVDLSRDLLELCNSEGMQGGPNEVCGSGLKIDPYCGATLPGLFGAGNSADQCRSMHMAVTSGIHAGAQAAAFAKLLDGPPPYEQRQVNAVKERLFAPTRRKGLLDWREFEDVLQRIVTEGLGPARSAWGMEKAWENLELLEKWRPEVTAQAGHDLLRLHEVYNLTTVARCMLAAASRRQLAGSIDGRPGGRRPSASGLSTVVLSPSDLRRNDSCRRWWILILARGAGSAKTVAPWTSFILIRKAAGRRSATRKSAGTAAPAARPAPRKPSPFASPCGSWSRPGWSLIEGFFGGFGVFGVRTPKRSPCF
jgi:adenylylsulfate reductase subunit A